MTPGKGSIDLSTSNELNPVFSSLVQPTIQHYRLDTEESVNSPIDGSFEEALPVMLCLEFCRLRTDEISRGIVRFLYRVHCQHAPVIRWDYADILKSNKNHL